VKFLHVVFTQIPDDETGQHGLHKKLSLQHQLLADR
jgi:hypothetical protein